MFVLGIIFIAFIIGVIIVVSAFGVTNESFIIVFVNLAIAASYLLGTGLLKELILAFKLAAGKLSGTVELYEKAIKTIRTTMKILWISGAIGFLIGLVPLVFRNHELASKTPYITFMLISVVYASIGNLFLLPIKTRLVILNSHANKK